MDGLGNKQNVTKDVVEKPLDYYYKYNPLPEGSIRLMQILPTCCSRPRKSLNGSVSTPDSGLEKQLKIELEVFPLSRCPAYKALSYTWGLSGSLSDQPDETFTSVASCFPIICEGKIILGTRNLRDAMQSIRYWIDRTFDHDLTDEERECMNSLFGNVFYLWIDAVCIDQSNTIERNHQVRLMSQIYKSAEITFVWLGKEDSWTHEGTVAISKVLENVKRAFAESGRVGQGVPVEPVNISSTEKIACYTILARNWFSRYWILQEVLLSRNVMVLIGRVVTSFKAYERTRALAQLLVRDFYSAEYECLSHEAVDQIASRVMQNIDTLTCMEKCRDQFHRGSLPSFMDVIGMCRAQKCSDPRDRIYSILGICSEFSDGEKILVQPDYAKSIEDVYLEATTFIIHKRMDLAVLCLVQGDLSSRCVPSWCPDYRDISHTLFANGYRDEARPWRIQNEPACIPSVTNRHLTVCGQQIGVVQEAAGLSGEDQLTYNGVCGILSLLTRLEIESSSVLDRMQSLGRVDLFWHTVMSHMSSVLDQLANWTERDLPAGAGLLLPQLIRCLFCLELPKHQDRVDIAKLFLVIQQLESLLAALIELEPKKAPFLPKPHEFMECFDPDDTSSGSFYKKGLLKSRDDHFMLRAEAAKLNLYLPSGFTSKSRVDLGNDRISDFYFTQTMNWDFGFTNGLLPLKGSVFFRTDRHTLGMAKYLNPQPNDEVWVLDGAYAPICLRPSVSGNYRVLGEVYIHEIMNGEAVQACTDPVRIVIE